MKPGLIKKLLEEKVLQAQECRDNVEFVGESLIYSLGIKRVNPAEPVDEQVGYERSRELLTQVCSAFPKPSNIIRVAPFVNAYLGADVFDLAVKTVIDRAKKHPKEQLMLDEVLTATTLVRPEKRVEFLDSVRNAKDISDEMFGLGTLITAAEPTASFSTPDELPGQFRNQDTLRATSLIGKLIELGLFVPGQGFGKKYDALNRKMNGLDYLAKDPNQNNAVFITPLGRWSEFTEGLNLNLEISSDYRARPNSTGENPEIVFVNAPVKFSEVKQLYPQSTVLYFARNATEAKAIRVASEVNPDLVIADQKDPVKVLRAHVNFVRTGRRTGAIDLDAIISAKLEEAKALALAGNEHYYDLRNEFEDLGKANLVDDLIKAEKIKLPIRTNNNLVMLLSPTESELLPYFKGATNKSVRHYSQLPKIEETGMPFVIITNQPVKEADVHAKFPSATVLYFARDDHEESAIYKANGAETFIVNGELVRKTIGGRGTRPSEIGYSVVQMFFQPIAEARPKGKVDLKEIIMGISARIKAVRDQILFSQGLNDYFQTARDYWNLQEQYKSVPIIAQQMDGVLMQTCPTGGCLKMTDRPHGGCGANYGRVLTDFARDYRRQIGEENFAIELEKHNKGGKPIKPWYFHEAYYLREFPEKTVKGKPTKYRTTF